MKLAATDNIIEIALREDLPAGDITSESIIPAASRSHAIILAKEAGVLAGLGVARQVFKKVDPLTTFKAIFKDGQEFQPGDVLARLKGRAISLLKAERTALNFLQRMSGVATKTRQYVKAVSGTRTRILDTRKTTPGLRLLEKYAVKMGGGVNHRLNLSDMVLIKDNHLMIVPSILQAVRLAKERSGRGIKVEVEVRNFRQAREAAEAGADMIMLDNMPLKRMKAIVDRLRSKVPIEVSGKVKLEEARKIAALGVDFISVGALTHSYKSVDLSLEFLG
jgi:nicotinate-nucleotide pyrophosphorylase (carboxylating)